MKQLYTIFLCSAGTLFSPIFTTEQSNPLEQMLRNKALVFAFEQCDEDTVTGLLAQGANLNHKLLVDTSTSFGGITPTNSTTYKQMLLLLDHLLVHFKDQPEKCEASIRLLLKFGFNPNYINTFARSPLWYAPTAPIASLLIAHGCTNLNQTDQCGRRALHEAIRHGRYDVVQTLLLHGALATVKDNADYTPYDLICNSQRQAHKICKAILKEGPITQWFAELPSMRNLPLDLKLKIIEYIPLDPSLSNPVVNPNQINFADLHIQETVDALSQ